MILLTNDPSVTAWGWAVIELSSDNTNVIDAGCIKTKPDYKKKRIRKSDDTARRLNEISSELVELNKEYGLDWIVSEAPHGSQSSSAAMMIGAVTGIVSAYATCLDLPVEWYSEGDCKKHLSGKRSLTKKKTIELITETYGDGWHQQYKYQNEAVADALAVYNVAKDKSQALIYASNN